MREAVLPDEAVIPLIQHIGAPNTPVVHKGDYVEEGQVLGNSESYISSPVHSSIYGTVKDIEKRFHPSLGPVLSVVIARDKEKPPKVYNRSEVFDHAPEAIIDRVKNSGIVGMGGAAFPTHVKLAVPKGKEIKTLIINGSECEPFLTCDHTLMTRKPDEILKGVELMTDVIRPKEVFIALEDNKKAAFLAFQKIISISESRSVRDIKLVMVKTKYPQGGEKQLIKAITGIETAPGKLPIDSGCLVQNAGTVFAVYEALFCNKPLIERIVTVSGDCLESPGNYMVRIGTTVREMIERHRIGIKKDPAKMIIGGPMMGFSEPNLDVPVLKSTSGVLFFSERSARVYKEANCIRCARCVDVCPMRLSPTEVIKNVKMEDWKTVEGLHVADCMECGACAYSCPARIPIVQYVKEGKIALRKRKE